MGWKDTIKKDEPHKEVSAEKKEKPTGWRSTITELDPGYGPIKTGEMRSPLDVDWFAAMKNEFTKDPGPSARAGTRNPMLGLFGPAAAEAGAIAAGKAGSTVLSALESAATSPLPAKAATMGSRGLSKLFRAMHTVRTPGEVLIGKAVDFANPISRVAGLTVRAQNAIAIALDKAPQLLGQFAPILKEAAKRGTLPATIQALTNDEPEFNKIVAGLSMED